MRGIDSPAILARDRQIDWYARQILDGNMSLADAIAGHTKEIWAISDAYRKLAEDAIAIQSPIYYLCSRCAKDIK